jgi:S-formylglutathione hydrolase FrmB
MTLDVARALAQEHADRYGVDVGIYEFPGGSHGYGMSAYDFIARCQGGKRVETVKPTP